MTTIPSVKNLEKLKSLSEIFELVKEVVRKNIGKERAGLMLGLAELGTKPGWFIGAFHPVGSNFIVVNKTVLRIVEVTKPKLYNAYCFHILLHEYLHTIGILNEEYTRELTYMITKKTFGDSSAVSQIAKDFNRFFPEVMYAGSIPESEDNGIEIVDDFDSSNTSYIG